jgi:PKD repeat protein
VTVSAANQAPVAAFTTNATNLKVDVDGSGSSDPDGTIASYAWTFQGGGTATGATASYTFPATGTYTIGLTVTDDDGATKHLDKSVTVTALPADEPPANALAWDLFGRTVAGGWGTAQVGGPWTSTGTASRFGVDGVGSHQLTAGATLTSALNGVSATSADVSVTLSPDKLLTGGGSWLTLQGRTVGTDLYGARVRLQPDGTVQLHLMRTATALRGGTVSGLTYGAGDKLRLRVQVTGTSPTTINAKVWKADASEPAAWTYSITDSTAVLQAAGGLGIQSYLFGTATNAPVTIRYDDFNAVPVG